MSAVMNKTKKQNETLRHDWTIDEITALFEMPFNDLLFEAQTTHRRNFDANAVQVSTLLSIKTGKCSEDCGYCPQSARYDTELEDEPLMPLEEVIAAAKIAKENGSSRLGPVIKMVKEVKAMGMETCVTLGMLTDKQTEELKDAGLDYYNHNLDTSPEYYGEVITTRTYQDRLDTIQRVRDAGMNVCCGGIVGMGESRRDRVGLFQELANQPKHPESVPINMLVRVSGTPMENGDDLDSLEFIRSVAVARVLMPKSYVRLSAGREKMSDEMQAMCFFAGANSIFYGDKLLTTPNPDTNDDMQLFERLGIKAI